VWGGGGGWSVIFGVLAPGGGGCGSNKGEKERQTKKNRNYTERWTILMNHSFSPIKHITYDNNGILVPTVEFLEEFKSDIMNYFRERKEDE
jgi:hypothetical protein